MAKAVKRIGLDWPTEDLDLDVVDRAAKEVGESRNLFVCRAAWSRAQNVLLVGETKHEVETPVFAREQAD